MNNGIGETLTTLEASQIMNISEELVKRGLIDGVLPIGFAVKCGHGSWRYVVYKIRLMKYLEGTL